MFFFYCDRFRKNPVKVLFFKVGSICILNKFSFQVGYSLKKTMDFDLYRDRSSQIQAIEKTFQNVGCF